MSALIYIETITSEDLEYQQDYHEQIIRSFEFILERKLEYILSGYGDCKLKFEYNPRLKKFKLLECTERRKWNVENLLEIREFKKFI